MNETPAEPDPIWWLAFAHVDPGGDPDRDRALGAAIVQAPDHVAALARSIELGINPGCAVMLSGPAPARWIEQTWWDRFLTPEEARSIPEPPELAARRHQ